VGGHINAMSRGEVSMTALEAGTTLKTATNWHHHTERFSGDTHN